LDTLFEQAPIGIGFWDTELRYLRVNDALARINGVPAEAHVGRTIPEVLPDLAPDVLQAFRRVVTTRQPLGGLELTGATPAQPGVKRYWRTSVYPVFSDQMLVGVGAVCDEITELKRAESERQALLEAESQARARAQEISRLKDDFLSAVSHELRNPLNSILGWAELLESGRLSEVDRKKAVETIARNVRTQTRMVDDLLDFSRLTTGRLKLGMERIDLAGLVRSTANSIASAAVAKNLNLNLAPCEAIEVQADPDRLRQVVTQLLSNAVKFTPNGGTVEVSCTVTDNHAVLEVRDSGVGIDAPLLPHVFEPFRQGASTERRTVRGQPLQGMGLGLSIAKHLIELQGGTIQAYSEGLGRGAVFTVTLPLAAPIA
jgi:PAS domain S-box-containing protein